MMKRSILASFVTILGLAACNDSSSETSPGPVSPVDSQAKGPSANEVAGLWYSTSVDSSGPSIVTSHTYLRLSANQSLEKTVYRVAVDPDSIVTIDSSFNGSSWRLVGDKFIAILQFERVLPPDTFRVSLPAGNLVLEQISRGVHSATVYRRVNAIATPTLPKAKAFQMLKTKFTLGSQEQGELPSLLSIRRNGSLYIADLNKSMSNVENIDLILYEDYNLVTTKYDKNNAHLWSPKAFASDSLWKTSKLTKTYLGETAKAIDTRFASLGIFDPDKIAAKRDFENVFASATDWKTDIDVNTGDVIAINASGTYVLAKVLAATVVSTPSTLSVTDNFAVNLELMVYTVAE